MSSKQGLVGAIIWTWLTLSGLLIDHLGGSQMTDILPVWARSAVAAVFWTSWSYESKKARACDSD